MATEYSTLKEEFLNDNSIRITGITPSDLVPGDLYFSTKRIYSNAVITIPAYSPFMFLGHDKLYENSSFAKLLYKDQVVSVSMIVMYHLASTTSKYQLRRIVP